MKKYIHYGHKSFDKNLFDSIRNNKYFTKPKGGLWASDVNARYGWKDWCDSNEFRKCEKSNSFVFTLEMDTKLLIIDSYDDLKELPRLEDIDNFASPMWLLLDFEKIAKKYDAIEVNISSDEELYWKLYGWDCDSILVMNPDVVQSIE